MDFKAYLEDHNQEIALMQSFVEKALPDDPINLGNDLYAANGYLARCLTLLSEAESWLEAAKAYHVVDVRLKYKDFAADERKIMIEAAAREEKALYNKIHGLCIALKFRCFSGMNVNRVQADHARYREAK